MIALNSRSKPLTTVRTAYDLKPSSTISLRCIAGARGGGVQAAGAAGSWAHHGGSDCRPTIKKSYIDLL